MPNTTIREVARLAGVSLGTVSNYLNANKPIADETRQRIEAAIAELDFVPNSAVRILHGHRSHVLAFIVPDGANPFFREVARGIEDVAVNEGFVVVSCNTEGNPARESHYARALGEMRVHAAIAVASPTTDALLRSVTKTGARGVVLGETHAAELSSIRVDDRVGGRLAMEHVLTLGRKHLLLFGGPGAELQIGGRQQGYRDALAAAGQDPNVLLRLDAASNTSADRAAAARQILTMDPAPDAVLCGNDMLAIALEFEAIRARIAVPEQLAIIGYDDIEAASSAPIPLTTIHQPQYHMGRRAAELALGPEAAPVIVELEPTLILRQSTF